MGEKRSWSVLPQQLRCTAVCIHVAVVEDVLVSYARNRSSYTENRAEREVTIEEQTKMVINQRGYAPTQIAHSATDIGNT